MTRSHVHEIAQAVAGQMQCHQPPQGWRYAPTYWHDELTNTASIRADDGRDVHIRAAQYPAKERLSISGGYPTAADGKQVYLGNGEPTPSVTVAATKTAEQIAKEIVRRFLPAYEEHLAKVRAWVDAQNQYLSEKQHSRCRMEMVGCRFWQHSEDQGDLQQVPGGYGRVRVNSDTVDLELRSLPVEVAVAVANLLVTFAPEGR